MDFKKLFLQIISILLIIVVVVCVGTAIKRSGEPEKEYDFSENDDSTENENWFSTEDVTGGTEPDSTEGDSENSGGDEPVVAPQTKIMYANTAVNVRSGPGRGYEWLGRLEEGDSVTAVGDVVDEWQEIIYDGQTAYIMAEYLTDEMGTEDDGNAGAGEGATTPSTPSQPTAPSAPTTPSQPTTPSVPEPPNEPVQPGDEGGEVTPPGDEGGEVTPPSDEGGDTTPPGDEDGEVTPPDDESGEEIPEPPTESEEQGTVA